MIILSWNCRGLGNPQTVRDLRRMVKVKRPTVVFLMETKMRQAKMEKIRCSLGFNNLFTVDCVGKSGGLALLWNEDMGLEIQNYSCRHIHAIVKNPAGGQAWKFTAFYGHPNASKRGEAWNLLKHLKNFQPQPWMCAGDFNEILTASEKVGGRRRAHGLMEAFRATLLECELSDLEACGPYYTWHNGREGEDFTQERLDRAVASKDWRELYQGAKVVVEATLTSDHAPLFITLTNSQMGKRRNHNLKYEASWGKNKDCKDIIKQVWRRRFSQEDKWQNFNSKAQCCKEQLKRWQIDNQGGVEQRLTALNKEISELQAMHGLPNRELLKKLQIEANSMLAQEDLHWRQRAKELWLKCGDQNTKFFHACANQRRRKNFISKIRDGRDRVWESGEDVENAFVEHFTNLYRSESNGATDVGLQGLEGRVSNEMNVCFLKEFSKEEVLEALRQMAPLKAPGPDGLSAGFFLDNWDTVGEEVCQIVLSALNSGCMNKGMNFTYIALIPKIKSPEKVSDFRPISLCNVIYKIVSKVLANRLKVWLPKIISPYQSAFIKGRLITDNIIAAYETLHTMHSKMYGKKGYMAVKLDMSKAYDRVEWGFLEGVMRRMGFVERWIHLVMMCVTSASYSVLVNGNPVGMISPSRGLRQGDPISPYLFLLCAEALSSLLIQADNEGTIEGVSTSKRGPRINHLFFADDSLLFCRAGQDQWNRLSMILGTYEKASGQQLNKEKTGIFFSRNTPPETRKKFLEIARIPPSQRYDTYLGLPALIGKSRTAAFQGIKDKVWKRLQDWKINFLS
jgi:hypothetical protein